MAHEIEQVLSRDAAGEAARHAPAARPFDVEARAHQGHALPPEFAALERGGVPLSSLYAALAEAARAGVAPFDALLASGDFGERELVATLARALGVDECDARDLDAGPIVADTFRLASATGHLASIDAHGEPRFVIAARGTAVNRLAAARRGRPRTSSIALAAPRDFADIAVSRAGRSLAAAAAEGPARVAPELTVEHGLPRIGRAGRAAIAAALFATVACGMLFETVGVTLLVCAGLLFAVMNGFRLWLAMAHVADMRRRGRAIADADLPVYTVLVGLYREAAVIPSLLESLERLDYPALGSKSTKSPMGLAPIGG